MRPGYGGPVVGTDEADALELLLETTPELTSGRTLLGELRTYDQHYLRYHDAFREHGYRLAIKECRFTLDLTRGWDALFEGMDGERRRAIRRGRENDPDVVEEPITAASLTTFYEDYATVLERVGTEPLPRSFFRELAGFADRLKLLTLHVDGAPRGSFLYVLDDEQETLQHLFTAVKEEHFAYNAADLLHEHAIQWGIDAGYETYELRGAEPDFREGLFTFKSRFGATVMPLFVWERGYPAPVFPAIQAGRVAERRLRNGDRVQSIRERVAAGDLDGLSAGSARETLSRVLASARSSETGRAIDEWLRGTDHPAEQPIDHPTD